MRYKWLLPTLVVLAVFAVLGMAGDVNLAQRPQGSWLVLETEISPREVAVDEGFLTAVTLRNEGAEPATVDAVTVDLPGGTLYVGQAVGSDVAGSAEISRNQLRWSGPFTLPAGAQLTIRYWAVVTAQATPGQYLVRVAALSGKDSLAISELPLSLQAGTALEAPAAEPPTVEAAPAEPSAVTVSKVAEPSLVTAGSSVAYRVTFNNTGGSPETLDTITDWLPAGFLYIGLADGSQILNEPTDGEAPQIVWTGSFVVPAHSSLVLRYWVWVPLKVWDDTTPYTNSVTAHYGATTIGPAHADVMIQVYKLRLPVVVRNYTPPYFTIAKSAAPSAVIEGPVGQEVVYTVQLANGGDDPGVLNTIEDTLPPGFTFLSMAAGSDVASPPSGTTGKIVWTGPFTVAKHDDLKVIYRVRASGTKGTYFNSATATTLVGRPPEAPASAKVTVGPRILLEENFENGVGGFVPFTNYWRLNEQQWFWDQGGGYGGSGGYTNWGNAGIPGSQPENGAHDSLAMYLGAGAQQWTNYRYRTWFNLWKGSQVGVWFRGTYQDVETSGQWVTGYYFVIRVRDDHITDTAMLMQLRTAQEPGEEPAPEYWYHFSNPMELAQKYLSTSVEPGQWHKITIEVVGNRIKCYVDNELAIDYTDTTGSIFLTGTVGYFTYGKWPNEAVVNFDDVLVEPLD